MLCSPRVRRMAAATITRETGERSDMTSPVLQGHPFLDPNLSENRPSILRYLYKLYLQMSRSEAEYNAFLNRLLHPAGEERPLESNLATAGYYINEATHYVRDLLELIPEKSRGTVAPHPHIARCSDVLELLSMIFGQPDRLISFEAQRKLYLAKLFFDVDHCWEVQRGGEHKEYLEEILEHEVFSNVAATRRVEICYSLGPDGETINYSVGRLGAGQECWAFDLQQIEMLREGRPIRLNVYFYSCRFKREVVPYEYRRGAERYSLIPTESWPGTSMRRSASIVSKMIRKGESDPRSSRDLIGAMFIVENLNELELLKELLFDVFGGFFRVKSVVDTVSRGEDRLLLNPQSGAGYKVYKVEVDMLYNPVRNPQPMPYFFTVEIQLYTLENYLRTIHSLHYASHRRLKRRQFLEGLVPYLFPPVVYGEEVVRDLTGSLDPSEPTEVGP
jgi:hypothetical protein